MRLVSDLQKTLRQFWWAWVDCEDADTEEREVKERFCWTNDEARGMVKAGDQVLGRSGERREKVSARGHDGWAIWLLGRFGQTIGASPALLSMIGRRTALVMNRVWNATLSSI